MAKLTKEDKIRLETLAYALRIVKEKGVDEFEKEVKFRGATNAPLSVPRKAINEFVLKVKNQTIDIMQILCMMTLHDEFGFGTERCQRFYNRLEFKADCISDDYAEWDDYIATIKDELGFELKIRQNNKDVHYKSE